MTVERARLAVFCLYCHCLFCYNIIITEMLMGVSVFSRAVYGKYQIKAISLEEEYDEEVCSNLHSSVACSWRFLYPSGRPNRGNRFRYDTHGAAAETAPLGIRTPVYKRICQWQLIYAVLRGQVGSVPIPRKFRFNYGRPNWFSRLGYLDQCRGYTFLREGLAHQHWRH